MTDEPDKAERDERISRLIDAQIELTGRQNTLTRDVAALGHRFDRAVTLQAANAEQIKALTEQVKLLVECAGRTLTGPVVDTARHCEVGEEDARVEPLMNDLGITEIGSEADLPDRPKMREVAEWLAFSYARVRQLAIEGTIPCKKIKRKKINAYLFDKAALLEWASPDSSEPEQATRRRGTR